MKALITGATGFVGSHLARTLLQRGDSVRILARTETKAESLRSAGAEVRLGDLTDPGSLRGLAEDVEIVFHLGSAMSGSAEQFDRVDVQGTERLLLEAERAGVRRFVYAGTLSGYPLAQKGDGAVIDEHCGFDETGLLGNYARAKARAEASVLAANGRGRMEGVIVRLGLVCGVGASVLPGHVCRPVTRNLVIVFGDGSIPLPLTFVDNAIDALILGATVPGIAGESFNIVDDDVLTQHDYLTLFRQASGAALRVIRMPRIAYYAMGLLSEVAAAVRQKEPATNRYRVRTRLMRVRWDSSKAHRLLRWQPRVPLRVGLADLFRAYGGVAGPPETPPPPAL